MKRDKKRKTFQETLSSIDGVLAALNSYPCLEDAVLEKIQGEANKFMGQFFPTQLDFGKEILEHLVGTDALIEIVSKFLTVALPGVEVSLKGVLLANMQNLGTNCTIDPFIYEKAIKEGILFDLKQIDLYDKLTVSPLDRKIGKYYYFGIEGCESAYDILQSAIDPNNQTETQKQKWREKKVKEGVENTPTQKEGTAYINRALTDSVGHYFGFRKRDFDCLLWYMKNKAAYREVWGKRTSESESIFNGDEDIGKWINKKGDKKTVYYEIKDGGSLNVYKGSNDIKYETPIGSLTPMSDNIDYTFMEGKAFYTYSYLLPEIKKISRNKYYVNRVNSNYYEIYHWNGSKWDTIKLQDTENYPYMESLPTDIKKGECVVVDNNVYFIIDEPTIKEETRKDVNGTQSTRKYVSNVKSEKCIDITNDYQEGTAVFVDYDLGTNKENIKNGVSVDSSLGQDRNKLQRHWIRRKSNLTAEENVISKNCYYVKKSQGEIFDANIDKILIPPHVIIDGKAKYYVNVNNKKEKDNKYTKDFGILTLEFSPRTGNVFQSDGDPMRQQTPYDNVLHVFFGNVKELPSTERTSIENDWKQSSEANKLGVLVYKKMLNIQTNITKIWSRKVKEWKKIDETTARSEKYNGGDDLINVCYEFKTALRNLNTITFGNEKELLNTILPSDPDFNNLSNLNSKLSEINNIIDEYFNDIESDENEFDYGNFVAFQNAILKILKGNLEKGNSIFAYSKRVSQIMDSNENLMYLSAKDLQYPEATQNYYLKRTLFEFNADYVNSLQLFDPKVLAAQLITSLFGGLTMDLLIGATASWKTELIRDVVKDMVEKTIAAEDVPVSDCFFTFTNDAYNGMLRAADLRQAGLYSRKGEENGNNSINPINLLEGLNGIDDTADQAGQTNIIKGAIMTAAGEVCKDIYKENNYLSVNTQFGINKSFIDILMINLCTQLVMAMLSPKVYLLILINLEMFGLSTNFDLKAFLERFEALIRSIVKSIVDQFMQYLVQEIMRIIEELMQKLISKLMFEQAEMYMRLLKQIWMHLRMMTRCGDGVGWTQDIVTSADIISSDSQEPVNEC